MTPVPAAPMTRPARRWYSVDPIRLAVVAAILAALYVAAFVLEVRRRRAELPEIGRAVPIEELRAAWAEADRENEAPKEAPVTMPQPRPESRP